MGGRVGRGEVDGVATRGEFRGYGGGHSRLAHAALAHDEDESLALGLDLVHEGREVAHRPG